MSLQIPKHIIEHEALGVKSQAQNDALYVNHGVGGKGTELLDYVALNTLYTPTGSEPVGTVYFNKTDNTLSITLVNGSTLDVGQEIYFHGKASGAIANGELVQFAGVQGDHILMKKVVAAEVIANPTHFLGVATQNISNGSFGYVTWFGYVNDVYTKTPANQDSADWLAGDILYFSNSTGQLTKTEPVAPQRRIEVAVVVREQTGASETGKIIVRPTLGERLADLEDVDGSEPITTGDLLSYNATSGVWERGVYNAADYESHLSNTSNPHSVTAAQVGALTTETDPVWSSEKSNYQATSQKGQANGYASLDGGGKVPVTELPSSIMEYKGTWNATTNTPTLADGTGNTGDVYRVSVGGTINLGSGNIVFVVGDYCIYNGITWEKSDTTDAVSSVNGMTGDVTLDADGISDTSTANKFTNATDIARLANTSGTNTGDQTLPTRDSLGLDTDDTVTFANLSGTNTGDVSVADSTEIDFTLTGQQITASLKSGSIDETKLDTSTNASLDLADSAVQPDEIREKLTAARTYYVRTDGNDSNTGLANTSGGAFLTIQKAIDVVGTLDINGYTVTIQVGDGTYSGFVVTRKFRYEDVLVQGNTTTPTNVLIDGGATNGIKVDSSALRIDGMELRGLLCLNVQSGYATIGSNVVFGTASLYQIWVQDNGIVIGGSYKIGGSASVHLYLDRGAVAKYTNNTITALTNLTYSVFMYTSALALMSNFNTVWSAGAYAVTGKKYQIEYGGVINTFGAGNNIFLGNADGTDTEREKLVAARTYYVRTDGSDNNTGLANTSGGAFLTIQKAIDVTSTLDVSGNVVTIQVADGTYTGAISLKNVMGVAGLDNVVINGNATTPSNVVISVTGSTCIEARSLTTAWTLKNFRVTGNVHGIYASNSTIVVDNIDFYTIAFFQLFGQSAKIISRGYSISGNAGFSNISLENTYFESSGTTIRVLANIQLGTFIYCNYASFANMYSMTFNLGAYAVTSTRKFSVAGGGVLFTNKAGINYFPGDIPGITMTDPARDGWEFPDETWTYAGATSFTVTGDRTAIYSKGTPLKWIDGGGQKYGTVKSSSYSSPNTTVTMIENNDYSMASGTIYDPYYSIISTPTGFPAWFNYTPTFSASGSMTYTGATLVYARFNPRGKSIFVEAKGEFGTTGGTESNSLRSTLPVDAKIPTLSPVGLAYVADGPVPSISGFCFIGSGSLVNARKYDASLFGLGSNRTICFQVEYEMAD